VIPAVIAGYIAHLLVKLYSDYREAIQVSFGFQAQHDHIVCASEHRKTLRRQNALHPARLEEAPPETDWQFSGFLEYQFGNWFAWSHWAEGKLLLGGAVLFISLGAITYCLFTGTERSIGLWRSVAWLVAPDGGEAEHTLSGRATGAVMSLIGLFLFALVLTLVQDVFQNFVVGLGEGTSAVMESGHVVICGWTDETLALIDELCEAHAPSGGTVIVILTEAAKTDVESILKQELFDLRGSKVVVRTGVHNYVSSLKHVAADACASIILLPERNCEKEEQDAKMVSILCSLRGEGWPINGRILVVCSLTKNVPIFKRMGGDRTDIVMLLDYVAKLMVRCSDQWGLGSIINEVVGFKGSEFYIRDAPEQLWGCSFSKAALQYPLAVLVGVMSTDDSGKVACKLCPGSDYKLAATDKVVVIAADLKHASELTHKPAMLMDLPPIEAPHPRKEIKCETIMVFGWNGTMVKLLVELDKIVGPGTRLLTFAPKSQQEQQALLAQGKQRWHCPEFKNIDEVHHIEGTIGSRYQLEELPISVLEATRVFFLSDEAASNLSNADRSTITAVMQIRDILAASGIPRQVALIPEIRAPHTERQCANAKIFDMINSAGLPAQVIATIAYQPRVAQVLFELLSADDCHAGFEIRSLDAYNPHGVEVPEEISFYDAMSFVNRSGDVLVGWSKPFPDSHEATTMKAPGHKGAFHRTMHNHIHEVHSGGTYVNVDWETNPFDKCAQRPWCMASDVLLVIRRGMEEHEQEEEEAARRAACTSRDSLILDEYLSHQLQALSRSSPTAPSLSRAASELL
jgi:hypothetical protein